MLVTTILDGIWECFDPGDELIFVVDGCDDGTEEELRAQLTAREFAEYFDIQIYVPDEELFEVKANNWILKHSKNYVTVLFQDDIICKDKFIKEKIFSVVDKYGMRLGLMGGREGFEIEELTFPEKTTKRAVNWYHVEPKEVKMLEPFSSLRRTFLNRGPIVFTKRLIRQVGYLDEAYFPLWGDEMDYCARCKFDHKLVNVVFECEVESPIEWGATRKGSKLKPKLPGIMKKNWELFISRWGDRLLRKDDKE